MKKILIADDHPTIRNGLKLILNSEFSEVELGEADNGSEALKKIREKNWDLLILDVDMPGRNGLEVLKQLKDEKIKTPVLIFSMHPEKHVAIRALKLGASGYLSKDTAGEELTKAIGLILSGKRYITPSLADLLATQLENPSDKAPHELLSEREYQTMKLFAVGKTVSDISEELSLSVSTVSTYRMRILEKLGVKTSAEIISYAIRNNLV